MATLREGAVDNGTATVKSDSSDGSIYASARTSGAYGPGDEAAIKAGTGADWTSGAQTPEAWENTFDVSSLGTGDYHVGFVQETGDDYFSYDFNGTIDTWTHTRPGVQYEFDDGGLIRSVATDVAAYRAAPYNGTIFEPGALWEGYSFQQGGDNQLLWNGMAAAGDLEANWSYEAAHLTITGHPLGELYYNQLEVLTTSPAQDYISQTVTDGSYTSFRGWTSLHIHNPDSPPKFKVSLLSGVKESTATFAWVGDELVLDNRADGRSYLFRVAPGIYATSLLFLGDEPVSLTSEVRYYPSGDDTPVVGNTAMFMGGHLVNGQSPILGLSGVQASPVPVAHSTILRDFTPETGSRLTGDWTLNVQFYISAKAAGPNESRYLLGLYASDGTGRRCSIRRYQNNGALALQVENRSDNGTSSFSTPNLDQDYCGLYDLWLSHNATTNEMILVLNGGTPAVGNVGGPYTPGLNSVILGDQTSISTGQALEGTYKKIAIYPYLKAFP